MASGASGKGWFEITHTETPRKDPLDVDESQGETPWFLLLLVSLASKNRERLGKRRQSRQTKLKPVCFLWGAAEGADGRRQRGPQAAVSRHKKSAL